MKDSSKFPYNLLVNRFWTQQLRWVMRRFQFPEIVSRSRDFWKSNKGIYSGRRGFIIGNGPSLQMSDLTQLKDDVCIASNRIYLAYPETEWRPTYLTCNDGMVWQKFAKEMCEHASEVIVTSNIDPRLGDPDKAIYCRMLGPSIRARHGFTFDQLKGAYFGWTVTYINLQVAAHLGLNPIYLIGCDHYYGGGQHTGTHTDRSGVPHDGIVRHFHKDYRKPGELAISAPIELMNAAYGVAYREAKAKGIEIYNATRGGYLEEFPRADLDELLNQTGK
ncbi:6-hydroxymethylpterin diphosphokinase MptE-like protein [Planctomicrobium sp. SH668]|uniref:6-hydroxymethylpterin diphosphokinase MptE-like protein n=1 Tax=Planctomicrobium sp. SH668 TaxID=3448126 RepID=UPI003F5B675D